ncbi:MAG: hypothetical protein EHM12_08115 [Dehalococcoidia bacterium]|nr:MAG: hypothetical protein EHM12_08115 [Dehalococcoidia bacterium]
MKKIYYCEDEREFYTMSIIKNNIVIDWIKNDNFGEQLDQNVKWVDSLPFKINLNRNSKHCIKHVEDDEILLYPFQAGEPFYLRLATIDDIKREIEDCKKWSVSSQYYEKILSHITQQPLSNIETITRS